MRIITITCIILSLSSVECSNEVTVPSNTYDGQIILEDSFWEQTNGPYGGDVYTIAINSVGDIFVSPSGFWLYRSTDNGATWARIDSIGGFNVPIVFNESDHIFTITPSRGIYRSTDNGESWIEINNGLANIRITSLVTGSNGYLYAGSSDEGIYRSTDNGDNWQRTNSSVIDSSVRSIAVSKSGDIIAGTRWNGVFRSINHGESWESIGLDSIDIISIVINEEGHIFVGTSSGAKLPLGTVFRSIDYGDSWEDLELPSNVDDVRAVKIDSEGGLIAGTDIGLFLYNSDNSNWEELNINSTIKDVYSIEFDLNNNLIIGGEIFGLLRSEDDGQTWDQIGVPGSYVKSIAFNSEGDIFAGTAKNPFDVISGVFRSTDNGDSWSRVLSQPEPGDVSCIVVHPDGDVFALYGGVALWRSTDNGENWNEITSFPWSMYTLAINSDGILFAGGSGLYRSPDNGDTWTAINNGFPQRTFVHKLYVTPTGTLLAGTDDNGVFSSNDHGDTWNYIGIAISNVQINSFAVNSSGYIFAGTFINGIYRSKDDGLSWELINNGITPFGILSLIINSKDEIFVGISNQSSPVGAFRSVNNGDSWDKIDLNKLSVYSFAFDSEGYLLAGTGGSGVVRSKTPHP